MWSGDGGIAIGSLLSLSSPFLSFPLLSSLTVVLGGSVPSILSPVWESLVGRVLTQTGSFEETPDRERDRGADWHTTRAHWTETIEQWDV